LKEQLLFTDYFSKGLDKTDAASSNRCLEIEGSVLPLCCRGRAIEVSIWIAVDMGGISV
jgi:hypothetical protein